MRRALLVAGLMGLAAPAAAASGDRLAVELLSGEGPLDGVLAFERACLARGARVDDVVPVQLFEHGGGRFVRLAVEGNALVPDCLGALVSPRRGVDGTIEWGDGFRGGLVVPVGEKEVRIADEAWIQPGASLEPPHPNPSLVARLAAGEADAIDDASARDPLEGVATIAALAEKRGPKVPAALEALASRAHHPAVRRAAVAASNVVLSIPALAKVLKTDSDPVVRVTAIKALAAVATVSGMPGMPDEPAAEEALVGAMTGDEAWEVRRAAVWMLTNKAVGRVQRNLEKMVREDPDERVRAAALEVLEAAEALSRDLLETALAGQGALAATAVAIVAHRGEPRDDATLWKALTSNDRRQRIAASPWLVRINDTSIAPTLFALLLAEADQFDPNRAYLGSIAEFLIRHPIDSATPLLRQRLTGQMSPVARHVLLDVLSRTAPNDAAAEIAPMFSSPRLEDRAVAAELAPSHPEVSAKRRALLNDPEPELRAAAVIGLCTREPESAALVRDVALEPMGRGALAVQARATCGSPAPKYERRTTRLASSEVEAPAGSGRGRWPAVLAMLLVLLTVLAAKLHRADGDPTATE